ncbi:hypothetical protein [Acaryochloris thomasi]|uniref:hypothetical protein n=1 Tax=Acaryochloris thomasi TaxID=2929456 RepID=UPI000DA6BB6F|nr:hypothetical protein [Acaryochloris thomasi]
MNPEIKCHLTFQYHPELNEEFSFADMRTAEEIAIAINGLEERIQHSMSSIDCTSMHQKALVKDGILIVQCR